MNFGSTCCDRCRLGLDPVWLADTTLDAIVYVVGIVFPIVIYGVEIPQSRDQISPETLVFEPDLVFFAEDRTAPFAIVERGRIKIGINQSAYSVPPTEVLGVVPGLSQRWNRFEIVHIYIALIAGPVHVRNKIVLTYEIFYDVALLDQ